jgi:osmoprotectant transport system ATP-binding protein
MDEPFGAVDPIVRDELQRELLRLQRELGKTVVFVTHDIDEAFLLGNQVVILQRGGRIAQAGTPKEILANPANDFVADFIGAKRGKRALRAERVDGDRVLLVDAAGYAAGVVEAPGGRISVDDLALAEAGVGPKSRSVSNKTDQAGDA